MAACLTTFANARSQSMPSRHRRWRERGPGTNPSVEPSRAGVRADEDESAVHHHHSRTSSRPKSRAAHLCRATARRSDCSRTRDALRVRASRESARLPESSRRSSIVAAERIGPGRQSHGTANAHAYWGNVAVEVDLLVGARHCAIKSTARGGNHPMTRGARQDRAPEPRRIDLTAFRSW